jgi:hypothetical protein
MHLLTEKNTADFDARINQINRDFRTYRQILIVVVVAGVLVNAFLFWTVSRGFRLSPPLIRLSGYEVRGDTALCPGDVLDYTLRLEPRIPGVFFEIKPSCPE